MSVNGLNQTESNSNEVPSTNQSLELLNLNDGTRKTNGINSINETNEVNGTNGSNVSVPLPRSYSRWDPAQHGSTLVWRDVCVYAKCEGKRRQPCLKRIINNSTGAIQAGTLMALMGSSGAGKSTLMTALAFRSSPSTIVEGDILLNGRQIGPFMHRISGFVHQDDLFMGSLTVLEHMTFMAHLKLDRRTRKQQKKELILELLEKSGLAKCANTKIGQNDNSNVLSGGEKKRLAFATELLTQPTILFCDEPTTGLDSFSAQQLVATLQKLAQQGTTIMCTIHQPSSQLFSMFHQVFIMANGRVAFMGSPNQTLDFFAENGYVCPPTYNPADYVIDILADAPGFERSCQKSSHRLCDLFAVSQWAEQRDLLVNLEIHMSESGEYKRFREAENFQKPFWLIKLYWLIYRNILTIFRDPTVQLLKLVQKAVIALMVGLCFFGTLNLTQQGVQGIQGSLFIIVSENTFSSMYSVLAIFPQGFPLFMREKSSGLYNTIQYYLANVIAMVPGLILEPMLFVVMAYWIAGLRATFYAFSMTALIAVMVMSAATACGCLFSTAFNSVPLAMAYLVPFDYILMITSGVFIKLSSLSPYISWVRYLSWIMYANEALTIIQWQGVNNITCYENNIDNLPCLENGTDVLNLYSFSDENLSQDLWSMFLLFIGFNLLALFFLWKRARCVS